MPMPAGLTILQEPYNFILDGFKFWLRLLGQYTLSVDPEVTAHGIPSRIIQFLLLGFVPFLASILLPPFWYAILIGPVLFTKVVNYALQFFWESDADKLKLASSFMELANAQNPGKKIVGFIFGGFLGLLLGIVVVSPLLIITRVLWDIILSTAESVVKLTRWSASVSEPIEFIEKTAGNRKVIAKILGSPGWLLGGIVGIVCATVVVLSRLTWATIKNIVYGFISAINLALLDNDAQPYHLILAKWSWQADENQVKSDWGILSKIIGYLGQGLGGLIGFPLGLILVTPTVIAGRILTNTAKSFIPAWKWVVNLSLRSAPKDKAVQFQLSTGERSLYCKILGGLGYALGGVVGIPCAIFVVLFRLAVATIVYTVYGFVSATNLALLDADAKRDHDPISDQLEWQSATNDFNKWLKVMDMDILSKIIGYFGKGLGGLIGFPLGLVLGIPIVMAGRILTNTAKSFVPAWKWVVNLSLPSAPEDKALQFQLSINERSLYCKILGGLGYALGGVVGIPCAVVVVLARFTWQTLKNTVYGVLSAINLAYIDLKPLERPIPSDWEWQAAENTDNKIPADADILSKILGYSGKYLGGFIGFSLGLVSGTLPLTLGRLLTNTKKSFIISWKWVVNLSLQSKPEPYNQLLEINDSRTPYSKILGGLGYALGGIFGIPCAICVVLTRLLWATLNYMGASFISATNLALFGAIQDNSVLKTNLAWQGDKNPFNQWLKETDILSKIIGYLGKGLGGVIGFPLGLILGATTVTAVRIAINTTKSFLISYHWITKFFLPPIPKDHPDKYVDERHSLYSKILGGLGYALGGIFGTLSAVVIVLTRLTWETSKNIVYSVISAINLAYLDHARDKRLIENTWEWQAPENTDNKIPKDADIVSKILGYAGKYLGLCLGFPLGLIFGFTTATVGRTLYNISLLAKRTAIRVINLFLQSSPKDSRITLPPSTRTLYEKILSAPGLLIGGILGLATGVIILLGRTTWAIATNIVYGFVSATNLALADTDATPHRLSEEWEWQNNPLPGDLDHLSKGIGLIGRLLGGLLGLVSGILLALPTVTAVRFITNSWISYYATFITVAKWSWSAGPEAFKDLLQDAAARDTWRQVLGGLGLVLGGISAIPFLLVTLTARIFWKIGVNICFGFLIPINFAVFDLHPDLSTTLMKAIYTYSTLPEQANIAAKIVHYSGRAIGIPFGLAIGLVTGFLPTVIIRSLYYSGFAFAAGFSTLVNLSLKFHHQPGIPTWQTDSMLRWLLGSPGYALGLLIGAPCSLIVLIFTSPMHHTVTSFKLLCGSLVNGLLLKPYYPGIGSDTRTLPQKLIGTFGYIAAALVMSLPGIIIFTMFALSFIICAPLSLAGLGLTRLFNIGQQLTPDNKLSPTNQITDLAIRQAFIDVRSMLDFWGRLDVNGAHGVRNANGKDSWATWIRKCCTMYVETVAEEILLALEARYEQYKTTHPNIDPRGFFAAENYTGIKEQIKHAHASKLQSATNRTATNHKIDGILDFIAAQQAAASQTIPAAEVPIAAPTTGLDDESTATNHRDITESLHGTNSTAQPVNLIPLAPAAVAARKPVNSFGEVLSAAFWGKVPERPPAGNADHRDPLRMNIDPVLPNTVALTAVV